MKLSGFHIVFALLIAMAAGCLGAIVAVQWGAEASSPGLHEFVHDELDLSSEQRVRLEQLEESFAIKRKGLEIALRAANAELATAMAEEHAYGPKVSASIDAVHDRMGALQKATVQHVFDMRELLDEEQRERFDQQVSTALTSDPRE
jgi:nickel and cobalt resistance protein CnrR